MPEPQLPPHSDPSPDAWTPGNDHHAPAALRASPHHDAIPLPQDHLRLRIVGHMIGTLIVAGAIVLGIHVTRLYYVYPRTDDAYVRPNVVGVART